MNIHSIIRATCYKHTEVEKNLLSQMIKIHFFFLIFLLVRRLRWAQQWPLNSIIYNNFVNVTIFETFAHSVGDAAEGRFMAKKFTHTK